MDISNRDAIQVHHLRSNYLRKSHSSAAASISACQAFLPCPIIVVAIISYRYLVEIRSAAFKKTAARSAKGRDSQADLASSAASMALLTSTLLALEYFATTSACAAGLCWVRIEELFICIGSISGSMLKSCGIVHVVLPQPVEPPMESAS